MSEKNNVKLSTASNRPKRMEELQQIIRSGRTAEEKTTLLADFHELDIASVLPELTVDERTELFGLLGAAWASDVLAYVEDPAEYLEHLGIDISADVLENMDADDAAEALSSLEEEQQQAIISQMEEEAREDVKLIRSYDEEEIGSRMTTNFIMITRGLTKKQAMKCLVEQAAENDNLSTLYVVEEDETFYGALSLQDLFRAHEEADLDEFIVTSFPYVYAHEIISDCVNELAEYSEDSIPVLGNNRKLLGVITAQELLDTVGEAMHEDYAQFAALTEPEDLSETTADSMKKRVPWLLVLMGLGLIVSSVTGLFEGVMAKLSLAVAFQSLILDMAGNSGTQSLAVTIRVLSGEKLDWKDTLRLIFKELRVGFVNGLIMGILSCVFVGFYVCLLKGQPWGFGFAVSGCLGLAMMLAMLISSFTGTVFPVLFKCIGIDPAVASGPLITTLNDLVGVVTYYSLAMVLLLPMVA